MPLHPAKPLERFDLTVTVGSSGCDVEIATDARFQAVDRRVAWFSAVVQMGFSSAGIDERFKDRKRLGMCVFAHVAEFVFGLF